MDPGISIGWVYFVLGVHAILCRGPAFTFERSLAIITLLHHRRSQEYRVLLSLLHRPYRRSDCPSNHLGVDAQEYMDPSPAGSGLSRTQCHLGPWVAGNTASG
ncbi:hypothetical protein H9Q72_014272 [Fusarium xylarioides]|uniref:Uncharacterized protein n=1 Tax=Fusarium xylarioides TaxID=221167 RepID=A0A9P7HD57_9HYPO|nr:hypothetical protein H9Q70_002757 [Fusarium xylarioides]KAG5757584.1 hypothetical protein H9Q72_014272 [Fusarium xylarioides]KAG5784036.1 hypothetical protein H9Q73_002311 [Fusarium xylarioides]